MCWYWHWVIHSPILHFDDSHKCFSDQMGGGLYLSCEISEISRKDWCWHFLIHFRRHLQVLVLNSLPLKVVKAHLSALGGKYFHFTWDFSCSLWSLWSCGSWHLVDWYRFISVPVVHVACNFMLKSGVIYARNVGTFPPGYIASCIEGSNSNLNVRVRITFMVWWIC
jgi:hypothetical protein